MNIKPWTTFKKLASNHLKQDDDFTPSTDLSEPHKEEALHYGKAALVGGVVGAGGGALIGGLVGRSNAVGDFQSSTEITALELSWQEPVIERQLVGDIPKDENIDASFWNHLGVDSEPTKINPKTRPVYADNPVIDERGAPTLQTHSKTYEGYGTAKVDWVSHRIFNHELSGYDRRVTSQYESQWGCHRNWSPPENENVERWCIDYDPKFTRHQVGDYQTPEVKFERPDDVKTKIAAATWTSALKGAGIGLVGGVAAGVLLGFLARPESDS